MRKTTCPINNSPLEIKYFSKSYIFISIITQFFLMKISQKTQRRSLHTDKGNNLLVEYNNSKHMHHILAHPIP
jgi:hypothetical protein